MIHFKPLVSDDVRDITYDVLENFKDDLPRALKVKTRRNIRTALHDLFVRMHKKGAIKELLAWPVIDGDDSFARSTLTFDGALNNADYTMIASYPLPKCYH